MDKIYLKKSIVTDVNISSNAILSYISLRKLMSESTVLLDKEDSSIDCISLHRMAFSLLGVNDKYDKSILDSLCNGLHELASKEIISIINTFNECEFIIDFNELNLDTSKYLFVITYTDEIKKILNCSYIKEKNLPINKRISIIRYFIAMISTFNNSSNMGELKGKISTMSIDYISSLADICSRTAIRYNEILEELHLIFAYRSNDKIKINDSLKQIKNCYGRYSDREVVISYAKKFEEDLGYQHKIIKTAKNKTKADNNRRLAAIYNRICEGYSYPDDVVREVYKYIVNKNRYLQDEIDKKHSQTYLSMSDKSWIEKCESQLRNETIFDQFDFLKADWGEYKEVDGFQE